MRGASGDGGRPTQTMAKKVIIFDVLKMMTGPSLSVDPSVTALGFTNVNDATVNARMADDISFDAIASRLTSCLVQGMHKICSGSGAIVTFF